MMSDYTIILISVGIGATLILTLLYIWHTIFLRSWGRVINMVTRLFVDSNDIVDIDKKIEPNMSATRADIMKAQAETVESLPISAVPLAPQQAQIPAQEASQYARTTSESGWPRALTEEERQDPRPFRHVHIATENEELSQQADNQAKE